MEARRKRNGWDGLSLIGLVSLRNHHLLHAPCLYLPVSLPAGLIPEESDHAFTAAFALQ